MSVPIYKGHAFAHLPLAQDWRRAKYRLGDYLTDKDRELAETLTAKDWGLTSAQILDQGQTPHCVGFGWATWGNTEPVNDNYLNADGHKIYYEAVAIGGVPNTENGAATDWGARSMVARGRGNTYAWATSLEDIITWVLVKGSIVTGLMWTDQMADPDLNHVMHAKGTTIGGHETCWTAVDRNTGLFKVANSWGTGWEQGGFAYMSFDDMTKCMNAFGDCCTMVELPLGPPSPNPTPEPDGCFPVTASLFNLARRLGYA